jgi:predicted PurR-regulated permease PerM
MIFALKKYKKIVILTLSLLTFYIFMEFLSPVLFPIIFAFLLSSIFKTPTAFLKERFKVPKPLTSLALVFLFISLSVIFFFSTGIKIFDEVEGFILYLKTLKILNYVPEIIPLLSSLGSFFPKSVISFTVFIFSLFYFTKDFDAVRGYLQRFSLFSAVEKVISGYFKAYALLFLFNFAFLFLAFSIIKISFALPLSLAVSLFDLLPIVGTGTVLLPWSVISFLENDTAKGVFLLAVFLFLTVFRKISEPKLLGGFTGLHPLLSLITLSSGYLIAGVSGAIFFPFSTAVIICYLKPKPQSL